MAVQVAGALDVNLPQRKRRIGDADEGEDDDGEGERRGRGARVDAELVGGEEAQGKVEEEEDAGEVPLEERGVKTPERMLVVRAPSRQLILVRKVLVVCKVAAAEEPPHRAVRASPVAVALRSGRKLLADRGRERLVLAVVGLVIDRRTCCRSPASRECGSERRVDRKDKGVHADDAGADGEEGERADAPHVLVPHTNHTRPPFEPVALAVEVEEDIRQGGVEVEWGGDVGDLGRVRRGQGSVLWQDGVGTRDEGKRRVVDERRPRRSLEDRVCIVLTSAMRVKAGRRRSGGTHRRNRATRLRRCRRERTKRRG